MRFLLPLALAGCLPPSAISQECGTAYYGVPPAVANAAESAFLAAADGRPRIEIVRWEPALAGTPGGRIYWLTFGEPWTRKEACDYARNVTLYVTRAGPYCGNGGYYLESKDSAGIPEALLLGLDRCLAGPPDLTSVPPRTK